MGSRPYYIVTEIDPPKIMNIDNRIETLRTGIEKDMMELDPSATDENRRFYLAGVIDTMNKFGEITEEERGVLYVEYAF